MRLYRFPLLIALLLLILPSSLLAAAQNISAAQSHEMLLKNPQIYLLDVRTREEYLQIRLDGAHLIPIEEILRRVEEIPTDRPVLVYCAVGSRSAQVANYLARRSKAEVYNMYGGIWGWQMRGYPVLQGRP